MYSNDFKRHTAHENGKQLHEHAITRARKRTALDFLATVPQRASPPAKCGTVRQRDIEAVIDDSFRTDSSPMRSNGWSERWGSGCWILIHIMHNESMMKVCKSSFSNVVCSQWQTGTPVWNWTVETEISAPPHQRNRRNRSLATRQTKTWNFMGLPSALSWEATFPGRTSLDSKWIGPL